jgi:hypothetical protein
MGQDSLFDGGEAEDPIGPEKLVCPGKYLIFVYKDRQ